MGLEINEIYFALSMLFVLMLHYEPSLWKEYYPHVKYNPVCIESHKAFLFCLHLYS
jgi:hypothetical protein